MWFYWMIYCVKQPTTWFLQDIKKQWNVWPIFLVSTSEMHCLKVNSLDLHIHCTHTHSLKFYLWICHSLLPSLCWEVSNFLGHRKSCHVCLLKPNYMLLWHCFPLSFSWLKWLRNWTGFCVAKMKSLSPSFCSVHKISYRSCHMKFYSSRKPSSTC